MPTISAQPVALTAHAIGRWQERVDPHATKFDAARALSDLLAQGRRRPTPRRWTTAAPEPGLIFVYAAARPGVCALVRDGTVITVLSRALCRSRSSRRTSEPASEKARPRRRRVRRDARLPRRGVHQRSQHRAFRGQDA